MSAGGNARPFCTGIDLKELAKEETPRLLLPVDRALRLLERVDNLVICAIQGFALGGLQLPLACDIRVATEDAILGLPAATGGFIPGLGAYLLQRYIGLGRAKRMAISGENVDGVDALLIGQVDYPVEPADFDREIEALTRRYLAVGSEAARQTKLMLLAYQGRPHGQFFEKYLHRQTIAIASADHDEAMNAYREKQDPVTSQGELGRHCHVNRTPRA
ncbi:MAG: hypothetical protein BZY87_02470 [SAR202 cluster bacterium Io17-Chloro-G6]|nr:MAG: hypothetical protein BZY87_02470 [SAR202 cluster bacterium Io17-Chloro-G6]